MNCKQPRIPAISHYFAAQAPLLHYGLAVLAVVVATVATRTIPVLGERAVFLVFFFAIIQSSFWFGLKPALLAMVLSLAAVNALVLFPVWVSMPAQAFVLNAGFSLLSVVIIATTSVHLSLSAALRESRQRYAGIVESAMDAMVTMDVDQRIVLFNAAAEKMFGCRADEAIGKPFGCYISDAPACAAVGKMGRLDTVTGLRANGEVFPVETSISQFGRGDEKLFTAVLRDVTERMHADSALKERLRLQDQLTKVAASVPGVICSFRLRPDGSSHLPYASPAFESLFGLSLDVVAEDFSPFFACIHPDDIGSVNATTAASARTLQPWRGSFRYNHPMKGEIWVASHSMPTSEADGSVLWHGYIHDITESKRTEAALRESEARLALVVEAVNAGYWDWDLATRTLYLSAEWQRQIGFEGNELRNRWEEWECRLHPDDRALVSASTESYIAGRQPTFELEFRLRHKDGSYRWIHSRGALLRDSDNQPYRMLGINLDITDYVRTKEMSELRDKMEQSFRSCMAGQTVAAIAHELNQPLAALCSYADVALHLLQTGNQNPQKLSHVIENCALQAQRAGDVIRQLMAQLHNNDIISEPVDINGSIRDALAFIKADGYLRAFKTKLNLADDLPLVAANGVQIQKVLVNIMRNSLESMEENGINDGTLTITSCADVTSMVQVTVCDSGKGVTDAAMLKAMFQPFYTTKSAGLGMGLAISRALVEAHGGKMWAEQNTGPGLSVHFILPFVILIVP
ncbi:MAG: PAS domain S-box protein [Methylovulum sp.]|nr:PAS domain S-box protein [Methylovulum sp.]